MNDERKQSEFDKIKIEVRQIKNIIGTLTPEEHSVVIERDFWGRWHDLKDTTEKSELTVDDCIQVAGSAAYLDAMVELIFNRTADARIMARKFRNISLTARCLSGQKQPPRRKNSEFQ